jgi:hypothetical protein
MRDLPVVNQGEVPQHMVGGVLSQFIERIPDVEFGQAAV